MRLTHAFAAYRFAAASVCGLALSVVGGEVGAQSLIFQDGRNGYDSTIDTEFRAANPTDPQGEKEFLSIDEFDGGFQTQGAIRFGNVFGGQFGVPNGVDILFAELEFYATSATDAAAVIGFNRVLGPDANRAAGSGPWNNDDTWFSLGGDLIPDGAGLLDGDPIVQDGVESSVNPDSVLPASFNTVGNGRVRIDVTSSVEAWAAVGNAAGSNAANLGWAINNSTGNGWDVLSAEYGTLDPVASQNAVNTRITNGLLPAGSTFIDVRPKLTVVYAGAAGQGDLDQNGVVNLADYGLLLTNMAVELNGPIASGATGDLDFDRDVDLTDFNIFKNVYPGGASGLAAALAVPEPGTVLLAAIAASGVFVSRRR
ncbi:MAG: PEP-CTERM sorting domain-containing protein [Lacipirellulaceae bacterium]